MTRILSLFRRPVAPAVPTVAPPTQVDNDAALRPSKLSDFMGQDAIKTNLRIAVQAAIGRGEALDHTLFFGPPGLGKTTLANLIANEMGVPFTATHGPIIKDKASMNGILAGVTPGSVLFIDEIHALPAPVEEMLYPAMEDFKLDLLLGKGQTTRTHTIALPRFTLIGATTRQGQLNAPLRDRFGLNFNLVPYDVDILARIVIRSARHLRLDVTDSAAADIARRSRGTPRIANRLLRRCRDFAAVEGTGEITATAAAQAMDAAGLDELGLDGVDYKIMHRLIEIGKPVGLNVLAASVEEEPLTVADLYEPYLAQLGFLERTPKGRAATKAARAYFNRDTNRHGLFEVA